MPTNLSRFRDILFFLLVLFFKFNRIVIHVLILLLLQYIIQSKKSIGQPNIYSILFTAPHKKAEPAPLRLCLSLFSFYTAVILLLFSHKQSHRQELSYPLSWS